MTVKQELGTAKKDFYSLTTNPGSITAVTSSEDPLEAEVDDPAEVDEGSMFST